MSALRILIADDHAAVRRGIRHLLESHPGWTICAEAADGREAVEWARRFRPDVVLLDVSMPKLNGLEAARQIRQVAPHAQLVILTTHVADQLADEVRRAGAAVVVVKTYADDVLIPTIEALPAPEYDIHLGGTTLDGHHHIAALFDSEVERYGVLSPFIAEGLAAGDKALHIINPPDRELHVRQLSEHGIDVDAAEAEGRLELLAWEETYFRDGHFDRHAMSALVEELLTDTPAEGFPRLRAIAHMEWALEDRPGVKDLVEYETQLNGILPNYPDVVICAYDITKFGAQAIVGVIRAHPAVLIAGELRENPFYARGA